MIKIKKVREKLIEEIKQLNQSRGSIENYHFNFLKNFYENSKFMHLHLNKETEKYILEIAYRQYFVFLISCWETYFRDIFILIYTLDESLLNDFLNEFDIDDDVYLKIENHDIKIVELLSKKFNFQDIFKINQAFSNFICEDDFFNYINTYKIKSCIFNEKNITGLSIESLFENWNELINNAFKIRHKVIHDANYRLTIDVKFIQQVEAIFLLVPQIVTYIIVNKFNLHAINLFQDGKKYYYIFNMKDILADDWIIKK